jgi:sortase B
MAAEEMVVAGRRFRTRTDYEAALRDLKKIERIKAETDLENPVQVYELQKKLKSGAYRFETMVGTDFDDEIYEKTTALKKQGITPENAAAYAGSRKKKKSGQTDRKGVKTQKLQKKKDKAAEKEKAFSEYDAKMQKQILAELKKREKKRRLIVVLASLVAVLCFGYFGVYYFFAARTNMDYNSLSALKGSDALSGAAEQNEFSLHKTSIKLPDVLDEYKTLYAKNKKLIGWLKIADTNIDYPVMQTSDNEYYLEHNFNQEYDKNGSLFLDYNCSIYPRSTNLIIYGHHMKSGNMFGNLQKYAKESYEKEHSVIQFDSIYEKATYQVMYVFRSQVYNEDDAVFKYYQFIEANSEGEFDYYMQEMAALSLYDTGVTASYGDSLLTLSTCDSSQTDGRFVVVAKRIQ